MGIRFTAALYMAREAFGFNAAFCTPVFFGVTPKHTCKAVEGHRGIILKDQQ